MLFLHVKNRVTRLLRLDHTQRDHSNPLALHILLSMSLINTLTHHFSKHMYALTIEGHHLNPSSWTLNALKG